MYERYVVAIASKRIVHYRDTRRSPTLFVCCSRAQAMTVPVQAEGLLYWLNATTMSRGSYFPAPDEYRLMVPLPTLGMAVTRPGH